MKSAHWGVSCSSHAQCICPFEFSLSSSRECVCDHVWGGKEGVGALGGTRYPTSSCRMIDPGKTINTESVFQVVSYVAHARALKAKDIR
jgi:hypothetical protein